MYLIIKLDSPISLLKKLINNSKSYNEIEKVIFLHKIYYGINL